MIGDTAGARYVCKEMVTEREREAAFRFRNDVHKQINNRVFDPDVFEDSSGIVCIYKVAKGVRRKLVAYARTMQGLVLASYHYRFALPPGIHDSLSIFIDEGCISQAIRGRERAMLTSLLLRAACQTSVAAGNTHCAVSEHAYARYQRPKGVQFLKDVKCISEDAYRSELTVMWVAPIPREEPLLGKYIRFQYDASSKCLGSPLEPLRIEARRSKERSASGSDAEEWLREGEELQPRQISIEEPTDESPDEKGRVSRHSSFFSTDAGESPLSGSPLSCTSSVSLPFVPEAALGFGLENLDSNEDKEPERETVERAAEIAGKEAESMKQNAEQTRLTPTLGEWESKETELGEADCKAEQEKERQAREKVEANTCHGRGILEALQARLEAEQKAKDAFERQRADEFQRQAAQRARFEPEVEPLVY